LTARSLFDNVVLLREFGVNLEWSGIEIDKEMKNVSRPKNVKAENISLDENEAWETPLGKVDLDMEMISRLELPFSVLAHQFEHSGEVILPMLQFFLPYDFKIIPICMLAQNPENAQLIAEKLYTSQEETGRKLLIIASSDFSHHVDPDFGKNQDDYVINMIQNKNVKGVYSELKKYNVSACGYGPIMSLISYANKLGPDVRFEVLKRGHSGEVYPSDEVVDYVSMLAYR